MISAITKFYSSLIRREDSTWKNWSKDHPELPISNKVVWPIEPGFYSLVGDENSGKTSFAKDICRDKLSFRYVGIDEPDEDNYSISDDDFLLQALGEITVLVTPQNFQSVLPIDVQTKYLPNPTPQLITQLGLRYPIYPNLIINSFKQRMYLPTELHEASVEGGIRTHLFLALTALSILNRKFGIRMIGIFPLPPINREPFIKRSGQSSTGYIYIMSRGNIGTSSVISAKVRGFRNRDEFYIPFVKS